MVEDQPAVRGALLDPLEQAFGPGDPATRDGVVAVIGRVHEAEPARRVRGVYGLVTFPVGGEGLLLERDRSLVLAFEVRNLAQPIERLGSALVEPARLFEAGTRSRPIRGGDCLAALAQALCPVDVITDESLRRASASPVVRDRPSATRQTCGWRKTYSRIRYERWTASRPGSGGIRTRTAIL